MGLDAVFEAVVDGAQVEVVDFDAAEVTFHMGQIYDMLGSVWDWCWDIYDAEVYGSYRVLRGGGWFDEPWSCRASVRRRSHPTLQIDHVGFRVARSAAR